MIYMKKADWEKWDSKLREPELKKATGHLVDYNQDNSVKAACCLGWLEVVLEPDKNNRNVGDLNLPSMGWLADNGIKFTDEAFPGAATANPWLTWGLTAGDMNDEVEGRRWSFLQIADAIKDSVVFTDDETN